MVPPSHQYEAAIVQLARQISGPVDNVLWIIAEGIWNKYLRGQFWLFVVAERTIRRANINLTSDSRWAYSAGFIDNDCPCAVHWLANWNAAPQLVRFLHRIQKLD